MDVRCRWTIGADSVSIRTQRQRQHSDLAEPMSLHPQGTRLERLLIFGESGSGKSSTWMALADWIERTGSSSVIWAMDTDNAWDGMRPEDGSLDKVVRIHQFSSTQFEYWRPSVREIRSKVARQDWVVLDMADKAWTGAQNCYWQQKQGESFADVFAAAVIADDLGELSGHHGTNWGAINKIYDDFMEVLINMPCNVLAIAPSKQLQMEGKGNNRAPTEADREWARFGAKPSGQKDLKHGFHTILFCQETPKGFTYTTVKERGPINRAKREYLKGERVEDFVTTYLFKVAKWRP